MRKHDIKMDLNYPQEASGCIAKILSLHTFLRVCSYPILCCICFENLLSTRNYAA